MQDIISTQLIRLRAITARWVSRHFPGVMAPVLFALLIYFVTRQHSWSPIPTLPTVTGYLMACAAAIFYAVLLQGRRVSVPAGIVAPLALLGLSTLISLFLSRNLEVAVPHYLLYAAVTALTIALYLLYRDAEHIPVSAFCLGIALVHLPFVAEVVFWIRDAEPPFFLPDPAVPNFSNVRQFGEAGFAAAVCATALCVCLRGWTLSSFLLTTAALFGVIVTGSRGALLCWIAFSILIITINDRKWRLTLFCAGALSLASGAVWYLHTTGLLVSPNVFGRILAVAEPGRAGFESGRLAIWSGSVREVLQFPIFGQGPEAYVVSGCCVRSFRQSHNVVLQMLMEFGFVGCTLATVVLLRTVKQLGGAVEILRRLKSSPAGRVMGPAVVAYAAYGLIDGVFYHPLPMIHFALFCGLLAAALRQGRPVVPGTVA